MGRMPMATTAGCRALGAGSGGEWELVGGLESLGDKTWEIDNLRV